MHHPHHSIHDQAARTGGTQPQIFSSDIWALAQLSDYPLGVPLDHPAELPYAIEDLRNKRFAAVGRTTPDSSRIAELVPGGDFLFVAAFSLPTALPKTLKPPQTP